MFNNKYLIRLLFDFDTLKWKFAFDIKKKKWYNRWKENKDWNK